jgi:hypothetical protein
MATLLHVQDNYLVLRKISIRMMTTRKTRERMKNMSHVVDS